MADLHHTCLTNPVKYCLACAMAGMSENVIVHLPGDQPDSCDHCKKVKTSA